jgi:hypothetical protein
MGEKRIAQRSEDARLIATEIVGEHQVQGGASLRFIFIVPVRIVPASAIGDLLSGEAEEKEIIFARLFGHLERQFVAIGVGEVTPKVLWGIGTPRVEIAEGSPSGTPEPADFFGLPSCESGYATRV